MVGNDPYWYKDAIIYEVHVRAFHDSVGDGMGDFRGLTQKLDYLQDLGITAIWLLPFYPSPLKDDGYDIADYTDVHPHYGKLSDFREFLNAAHSRGLRVITEMVVNHTSDQHPWFQRARRAAPGSVERDFFVWSETPEKYHEARVIFKDFEHSNWSWDHVAKAYYWHRFYAHQPDLNFDNPEVWNALFPVVDLWLEMGVDGMRLDAVPYLYEREGTSCENLPETHDFLRSLRRHVDDQFSNRMLLAEANQWPEDAAAYFGSGDESHMAFHFPLMPRMFMAIHVEDRFPIMDILAQTPPIPDSCQWCLFLRNHDELTLEMVTDEERDYMYRAYANDPRARVNLGIRRRLAPLLGNNRRRIELMNGLLFSLPGTPIIYYGDEIGMGDNIYLGDRNGVRTPMQWSSDRNAGFSRANPQKLYLPVIVDPEYHYEAVNVEAQQNNPNSLLWWMKRLIALRKRHRSFSQGSLEMLHPANNKILAYLRRFGSECVLVVANLSRFVQHVELDLSRFQGALLVELFGRNAFPRIGKQGYPLTLGPHAFYWFEMEPHLEAHAIETPSDATLPTLALKGNVFEMLTAGRGKEPLEEVFARYLKRCRWIMTNTQRMKAVWLRQAIPLPYDHSTAVICILEVEFIEGPPLRLSLALALAHGDLQQRLCDTHPETIVARVAGDTDGVLFDALHSPDFCQLLLRAIGNGKTFSCADGELVGSNVAPFDKSTLDMPGHVAREEQTNVSIVYGEELILKVYRQVEHGIHPEVEIGQYLNKVTFPHAATFVGTIEYRQRRCEPVTLAVLHRYVSNEGTAWQYMLDELSRYFERVLALPESDRQQWLMSESPRSESLVHELIGRCLDAGRLLGQRTAEFHVALSRERENEAFTPEPFTQMYQRSIYQSMRNVHRVANCHLQEKLDTLLHEAREEAVAVLAAGDKILEQFSTLLDRKISGQRIRCHGDYNLCEVLYTGKDFLIIDLEGESRRSFTDRRIKRSPLRDVAGMIRSFDYAASSSLIHGGDHRGRSPGLIRTEDFPLLQPWARMWSSCVAEGFLKSYVEHSSSAGFLPRTDEEVHVLLDVFLLEKSLRELVYELDHRLQWTRIPLRGVLQLLEAK